MKNQKVGLFLVEYFLSGGMWDERERVIKRGNQNLLRINFILMNELNVFLELCNLGYYI